MKNQFFSQFAVLFIALSGNSFAAKSAKVAELPTVSYNEKSGAADFYAVGVPSMLKIHGNTTSVDAVMSKTGAKLQGTFKIPMKTFMTGMSLRDKHLKEKTFEVEKYPDATFTLNPVTLEQGAITHAPFTGTLDFHGVKKAISGDVVLTPSDQSIQHQAKFEVKLSDFNIPTPEFAGMKIKDTVNVEVNGTASASQ